MLFLGEDLYSVVEVWVPNQKSKGCQCTCALGAAEFIKISDFYFCFLLCRYKVQLFLDLRDNLFPKGLMEKQFTVQINFITVMKNQSIGYGGAQKSNSEINFTAEIRISQFIGFDNGLDGNVLRTVSKTPQNIAGRLRKQKLSVFYQPGL